MKLLDLIKRIDHDEWMLVGVEDQHRRYEHPTKPGRITLPGNSGDELSEGAVRSVLARARVEP